VSARANLNTSRNMLPFDSCSVLSRGIHRPFAEGSCSRVLTCMHLAVPHVRFQQLLELLIRLPDPFFPDSARFGLFSAQLPKVLARAPLFDIIDAAPNTAGARVDVALALQDIRFGP
jgi:hypothetical protein